MNKPSNFDSVNVGGWTPAKAGGHKAVIKKVEETQSSTGNQMIKVFFDFDVNDTQPSYFMEQFLADKQSRGNDAKWKGVMNIVTDERTDYGTANLKRFTTSVEDSNDGFTVHWGDAFSKCFENRKVGVVFRGEEYTKQDGNVGTSNKPFRFCNYANALEQQIPEIKKMKSTNDGFVSAPPTGDAGFLFV